MPSLSTRKIGTDSVTAIGYGAMGIAAFYGPAPPEEERQKVCAHFLVPVTPLTYTTYQFLDDLYASGCTNWDTANIYGDSEELIGRWCVLSQLALTG